MDQTARVWRELLPSPEEQGAIALLEAAANLPLTKDEALACCVAEGLDDHAAERALELAGAHDLLRVHHVADFNADFYYNDFLWGETIAGTATALAGLKSDIRADLRALLDEVSSHEGRPAAEIESVSSDVLNLAVAQGIIDSTRIRTAEGRTADFHFSPRFRGFGISRDDLPDVLDQVKLVISSFAFGTRFARYKLRDPEVFLNSLIRRGFAGDASPIGTDYGAMERQQIVQVEPTGKAGRFQFRVVKRDALIEGRDAMKAGALLVPQAGSGGAESLREPQGFEDAIATRKARRSGPMQLHDEALLGAIRDAAQRPRF